MKPDLLNDSRWEKSTNFGFHGEHEEEMLEILLREVNGSVTDSKSQQHLLPMFVDVHQRF